MIDILIYNTGFNPRTHVGCDPLIVTSVFASLCFNPRTHVGCDEAYDEQLEEDGVSIHAPT